MAVHGARHYSQFSINARVRSTLFRAIFSRTRRTVKLLILDIDPERCPSPNFALGVADDQKKKESSSPRISKFPFPRRFEAPCSASQHRRRYLTRTFPPFISFLGITQLKSCDVFAKHKHAAHTHTDFPYRGARATNSDLDHVPKLRRTTPYTDICPKSHGNRYSIL